MKAGVRMEEQGMRKPQVRVTLIVAIVAVAVLAAALGIAAVLVSSGAFRHDEEILAAAEGFLAAAKAGDMDKLHEYASDEVIEELEWDTKTIKDYTQEMIDDFSGSTDIDISAIAKNEKVRETVDSLVEKINDARMQSYEVEEDSVTEKRGIGTVSAKVVVVTEDSIRKIKADDIVADVEQLAIDYMSEHYETLAELLKDGDMSKIYTKMTKVLLPDVLSLLKKKFAHIAGEEQTWVLQVQESGGKWIVIGISEN